MLKLTQLREHTEVPLGHAKLHEPLPQYCESPEHTLPQRPQLSGSFARFVHPLEHAVSPTPHPQSPFAHRTPGPHESPHAPQFAGSVWVLTHRPLHGIVGRPQIWQLPALQIDPPAHTRPHDPQLFGSVARFAHVVPHMTSRSLPQRHAPPRHAPGWSPLRAGQTFPHVPQFIGSDERLAQTAPHTVAFAAHATHDPALHTCPGPQA